MSHRRSKVVTTSEGWRFAASPYLDEGQPDNQGNQRLITFYELVVRSTPPDFRGRIGHKVRGLKTAADIKAEVGRITCCGSGPIPGYKIKDA